MGATKYRDIEIRGEVYANANAAAAALEISAGHVRLAARNGDLERLGLRCEGRRVTIRGVTYDTIRSAAAALGVHPSTIHTAARNGTLHRVGTGAMGPEPMRVLIGGQVFPSARAAAAYFGCSVGSIWSALADGDPDRIAGPEARGGWKAKPFSIGSLSFSSMRAASRALGFDSPEFIAKAIKRGSKRGRERILEAAMKYEAQQAAQAQRRKVLRALAGVDRDAA